MAEVRRTPTPSVTDEWFARTVGHDELNDTAWRSIGLAVVNVVLGAVVAHRGSFQAAAGRFLATTEAGGSPAWGTGRTLSRSGAALLNGAAAAYFAYDDTADVLLAHPSVVLTPAIAGSARGATLSMAEFAGAYASGYETMTRIAERLNPGHYRRGFHATTTLGIIGAANAVATASGSPDQVRADAVRIAATQAAGLRVSVGTGVRTWLVGVAAQHGVQAAELAALGLEPSPETIVGEHGLLDTLSDGTGHTIDSDSATSEEPAINGRHALNVKAVPGCGAFGPSVGALIAAMDQLGATCDDVREVHATVSPFVLEVVSDTWPRDEAEAAFSLRFALTVALRNRAIHPADLSRESVQDAELQELSRRIVIESVDLGATKYEAVVTVACADDSATVQRAGVGGAPIVTLEPGDLARRWLGNERPARVLATSQAAEDLLAARDQPLAEAIERLESAAGVSPRP